MQNHFYPWLGGALYVPLPRSTAFPAGSQKCWLLYSIVQSTYTFSPNLVILHASILIDHLVYELDLLSNYDVPAAFLTSQSLLCKQSLFCRQLPQAAAISCKHTWLP